MKISVSKNQRIIILNNGIKVAYLTDTGDLVMSADFFKQSDEEINELFNLLAKIRGKDASNL